MFGWFSKKKEDDDDDGEVIAALYEDCEEDEPSSRGPVEIYEEGQIYYFKICDLSTHDEDVFEVSKMVNSQLVDDVTFEWQVIKKSGEDVKVFCLVFEKPRHASNFQKDITDRASKSAVVRVRCNNVGLSQYHTKNKRFEQACENISAILLQRPTDFESFFVLRDAEDAVLFSNVASHDLNFNLREDRSLITFMPPIQTSVPSLFALEFVGPTGAEDFVSFADTLDRLLLEKATRAKQQKQDYYNDAAFERMDEGDDTDVEMAYFSETEESEPSSPVTPRRGRKDASSDSYQEKNNFMQMGKERVFVGKNKGEIDVYSMISSPTKRTNLPHIHTIKNLKDKSGNEFTAKTAMLHNGGEQLVIPQLHSSTAALLQIETGQIVQHWDANEMKIEGVFPTTKGAQLENIQTFNAFSRNGFFVMDPRCIEGVAESQTNRTTSLIYSQNPKISCGATDQYGHIALGSLMGDIRAYNGEANEEGKFKRAKTHLLGLGDPIKGIDVTADGSWILSTCRRYLMLTPTKLKDSHKTAFTTPLGKNKPQPIKLRIKDEDIQKYNIPWPIEFETAHFDFTTGESINTSTGNFAIVWDFKQIKRGNLQAYTIKKMKGRIVESHFDLNSNDAVVVAYPDAVVKHCITRGHNR